MNKPAFSFVSAPLRGHTLPRRVRRKRRWTSFYNREILSRPHSFCGWIELNIKESGWERSGKVPAEGFSPRSRGFSSRYTFHAALHWSERHFVVDVQG